MAERLKCAAITIFLTQVWAFYWGIWWIYIYVDIHVQDSRSLKFQALASQFQEYEDR
jgi:hypothetical protein